MKKLVYLFFLPLSLWAQTPPENEFSFIIFGDSQFEQPAEFNPGAETNVLHYINHPKVFPINAAVRVLPVPGGP